MVYPLPTKTKPKTDVEILVAKFEEWADERIADYKAAPALSDTSRNLNGARITTLQFAKGNLKRLAQEVISGNSN